MRASRVPLMSLKCSECGLPFLRVPDAPFHATGENDEAVCFECYSKAFSRGRPVSILVVGFSARKDDDPLFAIRYTDTGVWTAGTLAGATVALSDEQARILIPYGW